MCNASIEQRLKALKNRFINEAGNRAAFNRALSLLEGYAEEDRNARLRILNERAARVRERANDVQGYDRRVFEDSLEGICEICLKRYEYELKQYNAKKKQGLPVPPNPPSHGNFKECIKMRRVRGGDQYYCSRTGGILWSIWDPEDERLCDAQKDNPNLNEGNFALSKNLVDEVNPHDYAPWMRIINSQNANMLYKNDADFTPVSTTIEGQIHREFHDALIRMCTVNFMIGRKYARFHLQRFLYHFLMNFHGMSSNAQDEMLSNLRKEKKQICKACLYTACKELNIFGWENSDTPTRSNPDMAGMTMISNDHTTPPMYDYPSGVDIEVLFRAMLPEHLKYLTQPFEHAARHLINDLGIESIWCQGLIARLKWLWSVYLQDDTATREINAFIDAHDSDFFNVDRAQKRFAEFRFSDKARNRIRDSLADYKSFAEIQAAKTEAQLILDEQKEMLQSVVSEPEDVQRQMISRVLNAETFPAPGKGLIPREIREIYRDMWYERLFTLQKLPRDLTVSTSRKRKYRSYIVSRILNNEDVPWARNDDKIRDIVSQSQRLQMALEENEDPDNVQADIRNKYTRKLIERYLEQMKPIDEVYASIRDRYKYAVFRTLETAKKSWDMAYGNYREEYSIWQRAKRRPNKRRGQFEMNDDDYYDVPPRNVRQRPNEPQKTDDLLDRLLGNT